MDVHAGGQLHIHAVVDHLFSDFGGKGLDQLRVPGAGQGRAAGLQRAVLFQAKPRRAIGGDDGRHTFLPQALDHTAEGARVARHAEIASHHAVAAAEGFQLLVAEPGDKIVQRDLAGFHIVQCAAPDPGHRDGFRQAGQDPLPQLSAGFAELLALLHGDFPVQREAARFRAVDREAVLSRLQHEAAALLVVGSKAFIVAAQRQRLALAGREGFRLSEGDQHPQRLIQFSFRSRAPELHDLLAGQRPGVGNGDRRLRFVSSMAQAFGFQSKACVAQAEAEGIEHLVGVLIEIPIAHIDALGVVVIRLAAEVRGAGVVLIAAGDGVRELAAGRHRPGQHIRHGVAALHAALPDDHQGGEPVGVFLRPGHVHDIADVQQHHDPGKRGGDRIQQDTLLVGEVVAALGEGVLPILSRGTADHNQRGLGGLRGLLHQRSVQRHFGIIHRPVSPPAVVGHVVLLPRPGLIGIQHIGVENQSGIAQAVNQVHMVGGVHIAAAAVSHIEPVQLAAPEDRDFLFPAQRQRTVVFQQHAALGSRLADERGDPGRDVALAVRSGLLLHETVAHGGVDHALDQRSYFLLQLVHPGTPFCSL